MAYPIYTTPGFIVASYKTGEADKLLQIFTRDLGMIFARATGIRKLESKLRGHIQDYSLGLFSVVQGKSGWRLTNGDVYEEGALQNLSTRQREVLARGSSLLRRLYVGEEPNEVLFDRLVALFGEDVFMRGERLGVFELVLGSHILNSLGYVDDGSVLADIVSSEEIDESFVLTHRKAIISQINSALAESQL